MFTMENALIVALSQACRYLRDPGLDPRVKQFLKRELGSELVSIYSSLLPSRYLGRHATPHHKGEALRDDPNHGCKGE